MLQALRSLLEKKKYSAPGGEMMTIKKMVSLASFHSRRFYDLDDLASLDAALEFTAAVVVAAQADGHPSLPLYFETLAMFHSHRFDRTRNLDDQRASIKNNNAAIAATLPGDSNLPRRYQSLAVSYAGLFRELGDINDLEMALKYHHIAIDTTPTDDPDLLTRKANLSASYYDRFERFGKKEDLELSLKYDLEIINATAADDPELPRYQHGLAVSYGTCFVNFGDLEALKSAIEYSTLAVEGTPPGDDLAFRQQNLAALLASHFERFGNVDDIKSAIEYSEMAIAGTAQGHPPLPEQQQILAVSYTKLFQRTGDLAVLEMAIQYKQASVDAMPSGHPDLPRYQVNLAVSYTDRYRRLGDIDDLNLALKYNLAAVENTPLDHPNLAHHYHGLAMSYVDRFERLDDLSDIEEAIKYNKMGVEATLAGHSYLPKIHISLALCYRHRYNKLDNLEDLQLALTLQKSALQGIPEDDPSQVTLLSELATTYIYYYLNQKNMDDLDSALKHYYEVVNATPSGHSGLAFYYQNIAVTYTLRFKELEKNDDLQSAILYFQKSSKLLTASPAILWSTAQFWGPFALKNGLPECLDAYSIAFQALPELIWVGSSISVRHHALTKYNIPDLSGLAAMASIQFEKPDLAVEFLEQGLAVTYRQLLQLKDNTAQLAEVYPEMADRLKQVSLHLQQIERQTTKNLDNNYHLLAIERNSILQEIRKLPGFECLFMPPSYEYLSQAAQHGPVIMINCTSSRSNAIIILSHRAPVVVNLPAVTTTGAMNQLEKLQLALGMYNIKSRGEHRYGVRFRSTADNAQKYFETVLSWLSTSIVGPIFEALYNNNIHSGRIWWCPSGPFTYLPLHAAGAIIKPSFIQSYTSTLESLIQAREKKITSLGNMSTPVIILGVTELPNQPHMKLPSVEKEINSIASIVGEERIIKLIDSEADVSTVLKYINTAGWLHLACHGQQDIARPLKSGLLLQDGILELAQILETSLPAAEFTYLSACQTAMGDTNMVNESMHVTGGFIAAGFQGAVGTLWSMVDSDGPVVAELFYQKIFGNNQVPDVTLAAEALHLAVLHLRNTGVSFARWAPFVHFGI